MVYTLIDDCLHNFTDLQEYMNPAYAMAISSQTFETIEQLAEICKRMDDAKKKRSWHYINSIRTKEQDFEPEGHSFRACTNGLPITQIKLL